jgi:phage head maturation protease
MEVYVNVRKGTSDKQSLIVNVVKDGQQERYEVPASRRKLLNLLEEVTVALREMERETGS